MRRSATRRQVLPHLICRNVHAGAVAGQSRAGVRLVQSLPYGRFFKHEVERPLGDLYVTMLKQFGIPVDSFAENAGEFSEILARV